MEELDGLELLDACERHNKTAMKACMLIIADAKEDVAQAMIELESVMAGVVGFYCSRENMNPRIVLETLAKEALERIEKEK